MARTLVFACEDMHGLRTQPDHPLRVWAIEYAGQLLSRAQKSTRDVEQRGSYARVASRTIESYPHSARRSSS